MSTLKSAINWLKLLVVATFGELIILQTVCISVQAVVSELGFQEFY